MVFEEISSDYFTLAQFKTRLSKKSHSRPKLGGTYFFVIPYNFSASLALRQSKANTRVFIAQTKQALRQQDFAFRNLQIAMPQLESIKPFIDKNKFIKKINTIQKNIKEGCYYLINMSFPIEFKLGNNSQNLTSLGTAGAYCELPDRVIISFSPETFIRIEGASIKTYPIKGTTKIENAETLKLDPKEHAEQTMVVDLLRNDLGSICKPGSVRVDDFRNIIQHDGLNQMYSTISGTLNREFTIEHLMQLLPAGSITGTPKIEVMKTLNRVESYNREFYTGVVGYYDFTKKQGLFNILIRTFEYRKHSAILGVGAGITVDSDAAGEYDECLLKARSTLSRVNPSQTILNALQT